MSELNRMEMEHRDILDQPGKKNPQADRYEWKCMYAYDDLD